MSILAEDVAINLPEGTQLLGPFTIPDGLTGIKATIYLNSAVNPSFWSSPTTILSLWLLVQKPDLSYERFCGIQNQPGGPRTSDGIPLLYTNIACHPLPSGTNRQMKVELIVTGPNLKSKVTVEAY